MISKILAWVILTPFLIPLVILMAPIGMVVWAIAVVVGDEE